MIGDASGSVNAITGEGLCQAFQQLEALAAALVTGDLKRYSPQHRQICLRPAIMADLMVTMDRWPLVRRRALGAMAAIRPHLQSCPMDMWARLGRWKWSAQVFPFGWQMMVR